MRTRREIVHCGMMMLVGLLVSACSDSGGPRRLINGRARFLNGATAGVALATATPSRVAAVASADQNWLLSPDRVTVTLTAIVFEGPTIWRSELTGCVVTYDRSAASLSTRLDCPFTVAPGTYTSLLLEYSRTFRVMVNDPASGFFTDPASATLLSSTTPAGGPQFIDYTTPGGGGQELFFVQPLVVVDSSVEVNVVMHGLHTLAVQRLGTVPSFRYFNYDPVVLKPSVSGVGRSVFYSSSGTGGNVDVTLSAPTDLYLFYDAEGPTQVWLTYFGGILSCSPPGTPGGAQNTSPAVSPVGMDGNRAGGYLGLDASGTLGWALAADIAYTSYTSIWSMQEVSSTGATTILKCFATTTAPPPVSGNTYSSGVPAIPSPTASVLVTLVAQ